MKTSLLQNILYIMKTIYKPAAECYWWFALVSVRSSSYEAGSFYSAYVLEIRWTPEQYPVKGVAVPAKRFL